MPTVTSLPVHDRASADAGAAVGQFLGGLGARWRLVHDVPLAGGEQTGHLAVGPPGAFLVMTRHHPGAVVRVCGDAVGVDGLDRPHVPVTREAACRASSLLGGAAVRGVLAVTGARVVRILPAPCGVDVVEAHELVHHLRSLPEVLDPAAIERIYARGRRLETWQPGTDPGRLAV